MRSVWLILVVACGGSSRTDKPSRPRINQAAVAAPARPNNPHAAIAARARADAALHEDVPLDYERPFKSKPFDRSATAALFREACQYGDKHACIVEAQLVPLDERGESFRAVLANCVAGDLLSCRALPLDEHAPRFPNARGAMSRRRECQKPQLPVPCDIAALRHECLDGFPVACGEVGFAVPPQPDADELLNQWPELSVRGCRGGIASECMNVTTYYGSSDSERFDIAERLCELGPANCTALSAAYMDRGDKTGARDSLERSCEYGNTPLGDCIQLGERYVNGTFEEPVPGRGQQLLDWACPKQARREGEKLFERHPACKSAMHP